MIIGTAGHIDHGKTSLVKLLTGVDTDRLPEEKKRGISIDLGFAYTKNDRGEIIGFVDVPGHEKFINTMVAGAIGIDYGLLVVAADDGIMPQTIEHLHILELLNIESISVVITKIDLVDLDRVQQVSMQVQDLLAHTSYSLADVFLVSCLTGQGVEELKHHLFHLNKFTENKINGFRLAIDRVFVTKGMGVTVTGAVQSGHIAIGDQLILMPLGLPVKIRSIHAQGQSSEHSTIGNRCGLVLSGVDLEVVKRGQWLVSNNLTQQVERFDGWVNVSVDARYPIKDGDILLLYHGTDFTSVRLILLEQSPLKPGERGFVQFILQKPLSICWNDRFILRDMSARFTLAGGRVLDIVPPVRNRKTTYRLEYLKLLLVEKEKLAFENLIAFSQQPISINHWSRALNTPFEVLQELAQNNSVKIFQSGQEVFAIQKDLFIAYRDAIQSLLKKNYDESPESYGLHLGQLRNIFKPKIDPQLFALLIKDLLLAQAIFKVGNKYAITMQGYLFNSQEKIIWEKCKVLLENKGFNPPSFREFIKELNISEPLLKSVFFKATQQNLLVLVGPDIYYPIGTIKQLAQVLNELFEDQQQITVVAFRDRLKIGRNRVIHIIETFDKMGYTYRIIKKTKSKELIDYRIIKNANILNEL